MIGLLVVPALVERQVPGLRPQAPAVAPSRAWLIVGILVAALFVGILGPGISLR